MCEAVTLPVNHWHYVRNIDPTCGTLTLLVKHWPHLQIVHTMWETFTDGTPQVNQWPTYGKFYLSQIDFAPVNLWPCCAEHWFHLALTTWWITHTHTHTQTHHAMAQGREGSIPHYNIQHPAMYLTTVFNIQQYTSSQHSTPIKIPYHNNQHPVHGFCQFHQRGKRGPSAYNIRLSCSTRRWGRLFPKH